MDTFKIKKVFASSVAIGILRPVLILGFAIFVATTPYLKLSEWGPLIVLGAVAWAIYEGFSTYKVFSLEVAVSDDSIRIRNTTKKWPEISRAQIKPAIGMDPHIILHCSDGQELKIPAALDNVTYVASMVEKHVTSVDKQI